MRRAQLLGALVACAPLALAAGAPASPQHSGSSAAPSTKAARGVDGAAAVSSGKGHGAKTGPSESGGAPRPSAVNPRGTAGQVTLGRADPFHPLSGAQTRGRVAQPGHPFGPTPPAAVGGPSVRGSHGMSPAGERTPAATAKAPATNNSTARAGATLGGPRAQGYGHLSGQAIGRTTHNTSIDGSLLHRKFGH
jgi:hypothetical protein